MRIFTYSFWLLIAICGLFTVRSTNLNLVDARTEYGITQANPLINAPPLVVFTTVALGGFRGIIADILWMRSARLQYEGKFFELVQLADWITKLEPRFSEVWAYHAWNLSYNISILFPNHADRWRWVRHGFSMLRDEGLMYNPGEPRLLYELGWIFQHKIGGNSDEAHLYYKQAWANEMQSVFVNGRPPFEPLLNAAKSHKELLDMDGLIPFMAELQKTGIDPLDTVSLNLPERHASWEIIRLYPEAAASWTSFLMRQKLLIDYKLDPVVMNNIEISCGPLDWRLPQAHAIYWATLSKQAGDANDAVFANRMIYQSMADAFRRGTIFRGEDGKRFIPSPYPDLLPFVIQAYENATHQTGERGIAVEGYRNFLAEAAILMFLYDRPTDTDLALAKIKELSPETSEDIDVTEFVVEAFTRQYSHLKDLAPVTSISDALNQHVYWKLTGNSKLASGYEKLAELLYEHYQNEDNGSVVFPPFDVLRQQADSRTRQSLPIPD